MASLSSLFFFSPPIIKWMCEYAWLTENTTENERHLREVRRSALSCRSVSQTGHGRLHPGCERHQFGRDGVQHVRIFKLVTQQKTDGELSLKKKKKKKRRSKTVCMYCSLYCFGIRFVIRSVWVFFFFFFFSSRNHVSISYLLFLGVIWFIRL